MATRRIPIIGWSTCPDDTGECFPVPLDLVAANDVWDHLVMRFGSADAAAPTVRHGFHSGFDVPKDYVDGATLVIRWTASVTGDNIVWDFEYRAVGGSDAESIDQSGTQESLTVTTGTGAPSAAWEIMETTIDLTDSNFSVDDHVSYFMGRDGADGADDKAGAGYIVSLLFEYEDA